MANSARQDIMIAVLSALSGITVARGYQSSVKTCTESIKHWQEVGQDKFPALFPIDTDEAKESFTFRGAASSVQDMKSTLTIVVTSYLYGRTGVTASARCDLLRDIEAAMMNATAMTGITNVLDIRPVRVVTDQGTVENYSIHDSEFAIDYTYNHVNGG